MRYMCLFQFLFSQGICLGVGLLGHMLVLFLAFFLRNPHTVFTHNFPRNSVFILSSLVAQSVKNLSATQETQVQFLDWEDPLEKEMATHSSILAWRIPRTEKPGHGVARFRHNLGTTPPPPPPPYCLQEF